METVLGILLVAGKWVLIILVYVLLFVLVRAVRSEMRLRLVTGSPGTAVSGRLRVIEPGNTPLNQGQVLPLANEVVLGARSDRLGPDDIILPDDYVSARHARLVWDGVAWWAEDLDSTNGTYVGGRRIEPGDRVALPEGGQLQIGSVVFELSA
jgi:pSer/pThr/pTyr-binding forkhead associated (FHA) protein